MPGSILWHSCQVAHVVAHPERSLRKKLLQSDLDDSTSDVRVRKHRSSCQFIVLLYLFLMASAPSEAVLKDRSGNSLQASVLWKEKPVVVVVLRRPGCRKFLALAQ